MSLRSRVFVRAAVMLGLKIGLLSACVPLAIAC
jgi:hypothetical protein